MSKLIEGLCEMLDDIYCCNERSSIAGKKKLVSKIWQRDYILHYGVRLKECFCERHFKGNLNEVLALSKFRSNCELTGNK